MTPQSAPSRAAPTNDALLGAGLGDEPPEIRVAPPGPRSRALAARLEALECPAFGRRRSDRATISGVSAAPIVLASGLGVNVVDADENRYVDLAAGFGALLLGHSAAPVVEAARAQAERLVQALGDVYSADIKVHLLERLAALHGGSHPRVILGQSGSDAITAAIKTAKLATGKPGIVAFEGAYHGLGYAPLPACGVRPSYAAPFADQLNAHVTFAPYPRSRSDADRALGAVDAALAGGSIGAVLVEPILGRGGCVVPPPGFLASLVELSHRRGALVIADEIWTGLGRSGAMVRSHADGARPDILCFGKGLGGGLPISACVAPDAIMDAWASQPGEVVHTSTHVGAPPAIAAALATLDTIRDRDLAARARDVGSSAIEAFRDVLAGSPEVLDVRGAGMMIGVELSSAEAGLAAARGMLARGYIVITGGVSSETLTLTPPLIIRRERLIEAARALREILERP